MGVPYLGGRIPRISRLGAALIGGLLLCVLAAGAFALSGLLSPMEAAPGGAGREWRPQIASLSPVASPRPSREDGGEALSRPLFMRSRRPFESARSFAAAPQGMALHAIVAFGPKARAFVSTSQLAEGEWVGVGETLDGWKLEKIEPTSVTLRNGARSALLELDYEGPDADRAGPPAVALPSAPPTAQAPPQGAPLRSVKNGGG